MEIAGRLVAASSPAAPEFAALAAALRAWEPTLGLEATPGASRLFEPDGTLYALCLGPATTLDPDRKPRPAGPGDLAVVPRSVAVDLEPEADWLCLRDEGPPPPHFRERFIQVWAFELFRAPEPAAPGPLPVIAEDDTRHAISYRVFDACEGATHNFQTGYDAILVVGLAGSPEVEAGRGAILLPPGGLALAGPGLAGRVAGQGRAALLSLRAEPARLARRRVEPSPEFAARPDPAAGSAGPGC